MNYALHTQLDNLFDDFTTLVAYCLGLALTFEKVRLEEEDALLEPLHDGIKEIVTQECMFLGYC
jgi:hypothetical protein